MWHESYQWHYDYARLVYDAGFVFEQHKSQCFDKILGLIDIERIIKNRDVKEIEKYIPTVVQFSIDKEQTELLDSNFIKIFRLTQLSVEYLLFCKKYLDHTIILLKEEKAKYKEENKELKLFVEELKEHIVVLMEQNKTIYKCDECSKIFSSEDFLNSHKKRRHNTSLSDTKTDLVNDNDKIRTEIKELKGRINTAEKLLQNTTIDSENTVKEDVTKVIELQNKFDNLKLYVENEMKLLQKQYQEYEEEEKRRKEHYVNNIRKDSEILQIMKEAATQTDAGVLETVEKEPESNIQQFQEIIDLKITSSLKKIETKMQSFWDKLNEMDKINDKVYCIENVNEEISKKDDVIIIDDRNKITKPVVKPRTKFTTKQTNVEIIDDETESIEINAPINDKLIVECNLNDMSGSGDSNFSEIQPVILKKQTNLTLKPSNELTLARKSLTSLENTVKNDSLLENFRIEIEKIVEERMQDIGISPNWKGIPQRSYERALEIINHQADLMKKNLPEFNSIQQDILNEMFKILENQTDKLNNKFEQKLKDKSRQIEIKNLEIYLTDSENSDDNLEQVIHNNSAKKQYLEVIRELKSLGKDSDEDFDKHLNLHNKNLNFKRKSNDCKLVKGVLKNNPSGGSLTKKKVLFDLKSAKNQYPKSIGLKDGGSTTSMASSVFDEPYCTFNEQATKKNKEDIENLSDFDF